MREPVIVDPESRDRPHLNGNALPCAAIAVGTDGLLLEVYCQQLGDLNVTGLLGS